MALYNEGETSAFVGGRKRKVRRLFMNTAVLICTHGKAGVEMLRSVKMIMGPSDNVRVLDFLPGENTDSLVEKYKKELEALDTSDGLLILVDLFGGSPFNAGARIAMELPDTELVAGVNIPMLLEIMAQRSLTPLGELAQLAVETGKMSVQLFDQALKKKDEVEEDEL